MSRCPKKHIGETKDDFTIIGFNEEGNYIVECNICKRKQILKSYKAFSKRVNKHGKICTLILAQEYGGVINKSELKQFQSIWNNLRNRTNNPNYDKWDRYGGRGINSKAFDNFVDFYDTMYESYLEHVLLYGEENTTIDRIDSNGNYEPSNCRWATWKEQAKNKDRILDFKIIYPNGESYIGHNLKEYSENNGWDYREVYSCMYYKRIFKNEIMIELITSND